MSSTTVVWLRHDLRLRDNPALHHAIDHEAVVPLFIWSPAEEEPWAPGPAKQWWLHHSLKALSNDLRDRGLRLILRQGAAQDVLHDVIRATDADRVVWNRRYEPHLRTRDETVQAALEERGVETRVYETQLLHDPEGVETTSGGPYHVYTPFWNKVTSEQLLRTGSPLDEPALTSSHAPDSWPESDPLEALDLLSDAGDHTEGWAEMWTPGESAAHDRLQHFIDDILRDYETERDRPDHDGTSRLSPYLHHGEISPRQVWAAVSEWADAHDAHDDAEPFLQEIVWREFAYHMLHHYPDTPSETYRDKFKDFGWQHHDAHFERWKRGETGYPIVDAGMRQLLHAGWMHNRVRMIVASFLTKDLLIWWQDGARWFWERLVDASLANNSMGWQWAAGSGADAQPFFRIFNPVSQGERHDPDGEYVRRWIPELRGLPSDIIHRPWDASDDVLTDAAVTLGETYPRPMVDHSDARDRALEQYDAIR